jgi:hypothetical protein
MNIPILHVPSVFSQMSDDAIGACKLDDPGCGDRVRISNPSRLPEGGDMINIDS